MKKYETIVRKVPYTTVASAGACGVSTMANLIAQEPVQLLPGAALSHATPTCAGSPGSETSDGWWQSPVDTGVFDGHERPPSKLANIAKSSCLSAVGRAIRSAPLGNRSREVGEGDLVSGGLCELLYSMFQCSPPSVLCPTTRPHGSGPPPWLLWRASR